MVDEQNPLFYGPIEWEGASPEEAAQVGRVVGHAIFWEQGIGRNFREKCDRHYKQYRMFEDYRHAWNRSPNPADRDALVRDATKEWGAHLHIPLSFRTIETIVPRAIANMPKLQVIPREEQWQENAETVRILIDAQQERISIDLPFQAVMRNGGIYGIGIGKTYWRTEVKKRRRMERAVENSDKFLLGPPKVETVFDDPMFESVDPYDFMWDPYGSDMKTCEWVIHRQWLSTEAVLQRTTSETWATPSAQKLVDEEKVRALSVGSGGRYSEVWKERMVASGFSAFDASKGDPPHEVLEYHNGDMVWTILDRQVLVQEGENPCGDMPFQVFRPTPVDKQMVGIGWLEPLEHLQRELDTLRSQRRDKVTMSLAAPYAFDDQAIDEEDLTWRPNGAIPVKNASPKDAIWPIPQNDVPGSGWQEEQAIRADIAAVSGESDQLEPAQPGQSSTATEAQLTQASLSRRIELASRRFEQEIVTPVARNFLYLNQRKIETNRPALRVPEEGATSLEDTETALWKEYPVGPGELEGDYEFKVVGGAMAARNIPQDRSDAQWLMANFAHDWYFNPTAVRMRAAHLMGMDHPKSFLRDPEPAIPKVTLRILMQMGVDPILLIQSVLQARELSAPSEGPQANQVAEQLPVGGGAPAGQGGAPR